MSRSPLKFSSTRSTADGNGGCHGLVPTTSVADIKNITGNDQVTLTITEAFKIYVYEIAQSLSKFIFLLLDAAILTLLRNVFFPTSTRNSFCF